MTRTQSARAVAAFGAALLGMTITLTGCAPSASSGLSGEFYDEDSQFVIDGTDVHIYTLKCENGSAVLPEDDYPDVGAISDDGETIVWSTEYRYEGVTPVSITTAGDIKVLTIDGDEYRTGDKDAFIAAFDPKCQTS